jgi:hypothetical protein
MREQPATEEQVFGRKLSRYQVFCCCVLAALGMCAAGTAPGSAATPDTNCSTTIGTPALQHMHSHNDYQPYQPPPWTPLCSALSYGATSVEADVYLAPDGLDLKHGLNDATRGTIEDKYLQPLWALADNDGLGRWIYPDWPRPITLVVEIKDQDTRSQPVLREQALAELENELGRYQPMLTRVVNGTYFPGPVTVLLTGNASSSDVHATNGVQDLFANLTDSTFINDYLDGTLPALDVAPLVNVSWCDMEVYLRANGHPTDPNSSCDFGNPESLAWQRLDEFPMTTEANVETYLADAAHRSGLKIRFWGVPDESGDGAVVRGSYFTTELVGGLDYVSANSTEAGTATPDAEAVSDALYSMGDGCDGGAAECVLGARATMSVDRAANGDPTVNGTLWSTNGSWCGSAELDFFNAAHQIVHTVWTPQVCGTTPKHFDVAVNGSGPYAAVGVVLSSTENGSIPSHDFYYL